ncbi:MAG: anti-sigma B factor antagonist [Pseudomonadota bacterium]|nr:anti-sigma B factor antagonist [Pseudomonadota bacterium]
MADASQIDHASGTATPRQARVTRDGERLLFGGVLDRGACAALWKQVQPLLGDIRMIDLEAVVDVDSAGLALLSEVCGRNPGVDVVGAPAGLDELQAAYRLDRTFGYAQ